MKAFRRTSVVLIVFLFATFKADLFVVSSSPARVAASNGFTLEQVLSSPFPSGLVASPGGDKIAWAFNHQGKRNIWIGEAPSFRARQLTRYTDDDGQELTDLVFSPDGSWLAYVRGGAPNAEGEIPNPTSDPAGARREIHLVNARGGGDTTLAEGSSPFFSPRGDRVLFSRDGQLWAKSVGDNKAKRILKAVTDGNNAEKLFEVRGAVASPQWSPGSDQLAFASMRGDHSFIAVYDAKDERIKFLDASIDRDIEPRWSEDGTQIAFIRLFNVADTYSKDSERLQPWSIRVVDVATGKGREVWKSGAGHFDSFSRLPMGDNQLQWAGDRIVFAAETNGWSHLFAVAAKGGEPVNLTPGNYEVENVTFAPDRSYVVVASNQASNQAANQAGGGAAPTEDVDRRHLWKIDLATGKAQALTGGAGIEMFPVVIDGGRRLAFLRSTGREPLMPFVASADGATMQSIAAEVLPKDFPTAQLVEPEQVVIKAADGVAVHCQLFKPRNASGRTPAVVFMHGGPVRQMLLGWHYGYYYHNAYALNQYLASRGYTVLSVNFRSGIGYGRAFREAKNRGQRGASEYQDIVAAGQYLRSRADVDGRRVGLWGGSYGGFLTAMGLARNSDLFAAGVDIHGVHDWTARVGRAPWATGGPDMIRLGKESSPIVSVDKWKSPVLLIHGDDDRNVAFAQTVDLVRKLREQKIDFEQLVFPDDVHDFLRHENWLKAFHAAADFFDRKMK